MTTGKEKNHDYPDFRGITGSSMPVRGQAGQALEEMKMFNIQEARKEIAEKALEARDYQTASILALHYARMSGVCMDELFQTCVDMLVERGKYAVAGYVLDNYEEAKRYETGE